MRLAAASPWIFMWVVAGSIMLGCKLLTWWTTPRRARWPTQVGYWLAWPGLDAVRFLDSHAHIRKPEATEWLAAVAKTMLGAGLFWWGGYFAAGSDLLRGWLGMIGVVLLLHFGAFHLLSCWWRTRGVEAAPLMDHPWAATSVSAFWGRRWNRAFRDVTHRFLFHPLAAAYGLSAALAVSFFISGLLHEAVITLPARGGWGGPTLYFCLQAAAIGCERSRLGQRLGLGHGWRGWLSTFVVVLGPVSFLFPPVFVRTVMLPMMDALGAA
jgi:hypothetical protein